MLKPNNAWRWYFDDASTSLMLDLGDDMVFRVAINAKHLIPDAFSTSPFSVEDAFAFSVSDRSSVITVTVRAAPGRACFERSGSPSLPQTCATQKLVF